MPVIRFAPPPQSDDFLSAAKKGGRLPVIMLSLESSGSIKGGIQTKADWEASKSLVNLNTTYEWNHVFPVTDGTEAVSGVYVGTAIVVNATTSSDGVRSNPSPASEYRTVKADLILRSNGFNTNRRINLYIEGSVNGGAWNELHASEYSFTTSSATWTVSLNLSSMGAWQFRIYFITVYGITLSATLESVTPWHETHYVPTASLQTKTVDLGEAPSGNVTIEFDDRVDVGAGLTYTLRGSANGTDWTDLGTVIDGDSVDPYRYYDVTASFASSSNGLNTAWLYAIRFMYGVFDIYSSMDNIPRNGAKPYIVEGSVSSISTSIGLLERGKTGQLSFKLFWRKKTSNMIATGYMKGKRVACRLGFPEIPEDQFIDYFAGTFYDYAADSEAMQFTISTQDVWKQLKAKVPEESEWIDPETGEKIEGHTYSLTGNIIDVIVAVYDAAGLADRFIDRATFSALKAAHYNTSDWNVTRTLTNSEDADKLMAELQVSAGLFLYPGPDGRLTARRYETEIAGTPACTLDARKVTIKTIEGGQKEFFPVQSIYHDLIAGKDGGSKSDYNKIYLEVNVTAADAWEEKHSKEWLDKWGMSDVAIAALGTRMDSWYANPRMTVDASGISPKYLNLVSPGKVIAVDHLRLPCPTADWPGYASCKFLVMEQTIDPKDFTSKCKLYQVADPTFEEPEANDPVFLSGAGHPLTGDGDPLTI